MITSHHDWEEQQQIQEVEESLNAMVAPRIEDAVDLAETYK